MAHYAALWTSYHDPEFIQIRKVKQRTERYLAMDIVHMKERCRRNVMKTQEKIRENQDILDRLENEKETIARSMITRFHRIHRMKETAELLASKFRKRMLVKKSQEENNTNTKSSTRNPKAKAEAKLKIPKKCQVMMTHTFPYVYHSHGDKPCPRYDDLFHRSEEFGPRETASKKQNGVGSINPQGGFSNNSNQPKFATVEVMNDRRMSLRPNRLPPLRSLSLSSSSSQPQTQMTKVILAFRAMKGLQGDGAS